MSFEPHDYLRHIPVEVDYLQNSFARITVDPFMDDETLRRAAQDSI